MEKKFHLGELLKSSREKKNLTIEDVARITKIRLEFLKALESESYADLPERTYSLGYFRAYARFLEIDNVEDLVVKLDEAYSFDSPEYLQKKGQVFLDEEYSLINTFKKKMKKEDSQKSSKEITKKSKDTKEKKEKVDHLEEGGFSSQNKLIIVLCVFLVIFLFLGYKLLSSKTSAEEKKAEVVEVITAEGNNKAIDSVINNDFVVVENKEDKSQKPLSENTAPMRGTQQNGFQENLDNPATEEEEAIKTPKIETKYTAWSKPTRNYQISIAFAEDVWVQIYKQDDPSIVYLDRIFKAGDIYDIPKVDEIAMRVGNYKGVKILVDSKEVSLTSKRKVSVVLGDIILEKNSLLDKYPLVSR